MKSVPVVTTKSDQCPACRLPTRTDIRSVDAQGRKCTCGEEPEIRYCRHTGPSGTTGGPEGFQFTCARCGYKWIEEKR